jgi:[ribosomal protein S5]-alanine N-acetyltransferase
MAAHDRKDAVLDCVWFDMVLKGQLCTLRRWAASDAEALVHHADNPEIARQLRDRFPHPYRREDARAFLRVVAAAEPPTNFAIVVNGQAAGGLGYVPGADVERFSAEVGYWLGQECWGRGVGTEALRLFTAYAFDELGLLRLFALPFADNTGSARVLEKAGYVLEGILKASCVKYGQPRDQALYARINPKWKI